MMAIYWPAASAKFDQADAPLTFGCFARNPVYFLRHYCIIFPYHKKELTRGLLRLDNLANIGDGQVGLLTSAVDQHQAAGFLRVTKWYDIQGLF